MDEIKTIWAALWMAKDERLETAKWSDAIDALAFVEARIQSVEARVYELRRKGYKIERTMMPSSFGRYAEYRLVK